MVECNSLADLEEYPELFLIEEERKLQLALHLKNSGVDQFKNNAVVPAFFKFSEALKLLILMDGQGGTELTEDLKKSKSDLQLILYNNMASCHVLQGNWDYAIDLCNSVLLMDPANVKALYRRGWALLENEEYDLAKCDLKKVVEVDPSNQAAKKKLAVLSSRVKLQNSKYAAAMQKMFQ